MLNSFQSYGGMRIFRWCHLTVICCTSGPAGWPLTGAALEQLRPMGWQPEPRTGPAMEAAVTQTNNLVSLF